MIDPSMFAISYGKNSLLKARKRNKPVKKTVNVMASHFAMVVWFSSSQ
jgi:hypothetical protein